VTARVRTREWAGVDFYAELGVPRGVSGAAIDEAYRRQAKVLHPDRNPEATAEARFKRLTAAYEVLRDPVTRRAYDDFRFRVESGLLYSEPADPARPERAEAATATYPPPIRKERRPLPNGLRMGIGWVLVAVGVAAGLWALFGPLPSHSAGDTSLAVQITIGIMAVKFAACGVIVMKYPQLKARWHRPQPRVAFRADGTPVTLGPSPS
jgi:hypothetical protein